VNKNPAEMLRRFEELWDNGQITHGSALNREAVYDLYNDIANYLTELDDANCCPDCCEPLSNCDCDEDDDYDDDSCCLTCGEYYTHCHCTHNEMSRCGQCDELYYEDGVKFCECGCEPLGDCDDDEDEFCEECERDCVCHRVIQSAQGNEVVAPPLNAFDRAKWIKSQE